MMSFPFLIVKELLDLRSGISACDAQPGGMVLTCAFLILIVGNIPSIPKTMEIKV
jgi:hypothetical protein